MLENHLQREYHDLLREPEPGRVRNLIKELERTPDTLDYDKGELMNASAFNTDLRRLFMYLSGDVISDGDRFRMYQRGVGEIEIHRPLLPRRTPQEHLAAAYSGGRIPASVSIIHTAMLHAYVQSSFNFGATDLRSFLRSMFHANYDASIGRDGSLKFKGLFTGTQVQYEHPNTRICEYPGAPSNFPIVPREQVFDSEEEWNGIVQEQLAKDPEMTEERLELFRDHFLKNRLIRSMAWEQKEFELPLESVYGEEIRIINEAQREKGFVAMGIGLYSAHTDARERSKTYGLGFAAAGEGKLPAIGITVVP